MRSAYSTNDFSSPISTGRGRGKSILISSIISPGPGTPQDAGISNKVVKEFSGKIPILGVCLGHQCIGEVFGGKVIRAGRIMHGKTSMIYHDKKTVFKNVKNPFEATPEMLHPQVSD